MKKFNLSHEMFSAATFDLYEDDNFRVSTFKYPSGVEALKVSTAGVTSLSYRSMV